MLNDLFLFLWTWLNEGKHIEIIGLFFAVFAVFQGLRSLQTANDANELQLLPILTIQFFGKPKGLDTVFKIKNMGEGVAFDIKIEPQSLKFTDSATEWHFTAHLPETNILGKNEEKQLLIKMYENGKKVADSELIAYAASGFYSQIFITFKNARGTKYFTLINTTGDILNIQIPPTKLNLHWRITKFLYTITNSIQVNLRVFFLRHIFKD